jgi:hypothetical protein
MSRCKACQQESMASVKWNNFLYKCKIAEFNFTLKKKTKKQKPRYTKTLTKVQFYREKPEFVKLKEFTRFSIFAEGHLRARNYTEIWVMKENISRSMIFDP